MTLTVIHIDVILFLSPLACKLKRFHFVQSQPSASVATNCQTWRPVNFEICLFLGTSLFWLTLNIYRDSLKKNEMWWNKIQSCLNLKIGTDTSRLLLIVRPFLIMITKLLAGPRRWNPPFCQESLLGHSEVCPKGTISKLLSNFVAKMAGYECFPRNQKIFLSNPNQSYVTSVSDV